MRFAFVNHRYAPYHGGSERWVQAVAEHLVGRGHSARVVTSDAHDLEYFWDRARRSVAAPSHECLNGVEIQRVPVRHIPLSSVVFRGTRRLMGEASRLPVPSYPFRAIARHQPWLPDLSAALVDSGADVIHATNLGLEGLAVTARDVALQLDVPFILTPFVHLGGVDDRIARRYVSMPHQMELLREAAAVLTMTSAEADFIVSRGVDRRRVFVVGAGVHPEEVTGGGGHVFRTRHGIRGALVGSIGALAPDKGTIHLVRAVQRLRRCGQEVELVLAGPSLSTFERWYTALNEADRDGIHLLGVIDSNEKRDLLAAIDVFALPSRTESFGIVYLEAWLNRKPVIAASAGAVPELVTHGTNGLLTPFGDEAALADAIDALLRESALRDRLGAAGEELVRSAYTWDLVNARVQRAYEDVLGRSLTGAVEATGE